MLFPEIEDKALGLIDVGSLGGVGIVREPYCIAYTSAHLSAGLIEHPLESLCHVNLR